MIEPTLTFRLLILLRIGHLKEKVILVLCLQPLIFTIVQIVLYYVLLTTFLLSLIIVRSIAKIHNGEERLCAAFLCDALQPHDALTVLMPSSSLS